MIRLSDRQSDSLELLDDFAPSTSPHLPGWKILIVDDDVEIHSVTRYALTDYAFQGQGVAVTSLYSARETREILPAIPDVAVILLDVVMETADAGLRLVEYIRNTLDNQFVRIILRTGQPGEAPEFEVIRKYDINDYKSKTELTNTKLLTAITSSLRSFSDIMEIEHYRQHLQHLVEERTRQLHKQNEELVALNAEKNEFLGIAAHDLKNPLSGIKSLSEMLLYSADDLTDAYRQEFLHQILASSERMFELITNLLDVNAIEQQGIALSIVRLDSVPIVRMICDMYNTRAEAKQIRVLTEAPPEALVHADELAMQQVIDNIVSNAVKYSPHGKNITVRITQNSTTVRIAVQDEGPGLSEEDKTKLFGKFARLSARPTGGEHSTGLGLSIVKKMVEAMNGKVWCESELGKGACFIVELPRAE
ncbi:MAG: hybrid sensor histidine kinase/response regulator [Ignavibacteria bacterium]|nr:hybrid sensor histidine kinase/response regulator [Ignavibacteria bacterium]